MSSRLASLIRRHGAQSAAVEAEIAEPVREPIARSRKVAVVFLPRRKTAMSGDGWSATATNWTRSR